MKHLGKTGPIFIVLLALFPVLFWFPHSNFASNTSILRSLGQVTALIGTVLICLNFVLSARLKMLEPFFSGLNRIYIVHALVGALGFVFVLIHPMLLMFSYLTISLGAAYSFMKPSLDNLPNIFGSISLFSMILLIVLTLYIKMEYDTWKNTHRWFGFSLLMAAIHAFTVGSTLAVSEPLRIYMYFMFFVGISSFLYKQFSKYLGVNIHKFTVENVSTVGSIVLIDLKPDSHSFNFMPGQFAFLEFSQKGIAKQSHPFSIVSAPGGDRVSFAIKSLGDFTETLKLLTPGTKVRVEGPFGRFSYKAHPGKKQIWIAGGIGITPFLSMFRSLTGDDDLEVSLIYCVRNNNEALFKDELFEKSKQLSKAKVELFCADEKGIINAEAVKNIAPYITDAEVFVCGPPKMMKNLRKQFKELGLPSSKIHTEEFSLQ